MRGLLGLTVATLLLQGCIYARPFGNAPFADIKSIAELEGVYRNLGEQKQGSTPIYLSGLIWPERKDHASVSTIEVNALDGKTLLVRAHGSAGVLKEEQFVEGRDFELRSGRILLKKQVGFIGLIESEAHMAGPTYEQEEIGLDGRGHGKLTRRQAIVGLVMMIPMAMGVREDVRFVRVDSRESAERFFSGRPSGMAMAHNRVLDGSLESMADLLRIPQRFPDATERHKLAWQESVIAWWEANRELMLNALPRLTASEMKSLESWAAVQDSSRGARKAAAMAAFREALYARR